MKVCSTTRIFSRACMFLSGRRGLVHGAGLPIGSALRMGPGYFPIVLSVICSCGDLVVIQGVRSPSPSRATGRCAR